MATRFLQNTSYSARRKKFACPALTRIDLLVIVLAIGFAVLLISILLPNTRSPDLPFRSRCAANLKGIGTGMYTYANENDSMFPIAPHAPATEIGLGKVSYAPNIIGVNRGDGKNPESGMTTEQNVKISTTRNLWMLVRIGASAPQSFICPDSKDVPNKDDNPQLFWDFKSWNEVSYGYQVPYGKNGQPSTDRDQRMPLAADKGPYSAALENGQSNPGIPNLTAAAGPDDWRKWNSPNHGGVGDGEGQNVLFADSHVDFNNKPTAGIKNDNIYTRWTGVEGAVETNESARAWGTPPTSNETPWSNTDTLVYP